MHSSFILSVLISFLSFPALAQQKTFSRVYCGLPDEVNSGLRAFSGSRTGLELERWPTDV